MITESASKDVRTGNRTPSGFTLLEVLISISLLVLIISFAGMALSLSYRTTDRVEEMIQTLDRFRTSFQLLSAQIQSQLPCKVVESGTPKSLFSGGKDSLQFVSTFSAWTGAQAYVLVRYLVEPEANGTYSVLLTEQIMDTERSRSTVLFRNLKAFRIAYYLPPQNLHEEGRWLEEWPDKYLVLPEKLKITLEYRDEKYSMIVPILIRRSR